MKTLVAVLALALLLIGGGVYYQYFYPPKVLERATDKALLGFAETVHGKDRAAIAAYLSAFMADDVSITLMVSYFSLSNPDAAAHRLDFNKEQFIAFLDNTLLPLNDYDFYDASLDEFTLSEDRASAAAEFSGKAWGDGKSNYSGLDVALRFSLQPKCKATAAFEAGAPRLRQATCRFTLQQVPKPGEESKFNNTDALQQLLKESR